MSGNGFTSALAPELEDYLAFKEKMGFYGASRLWYLKKFDAYCTAQSRTVFDWDTVEGWVTEQLSASGHYRSWMSYIRDLGRWLQTSGDSDAYVLSDRWRAPAVRYQPYLLSTCEIDSFFAAAAALKAQSPWQWQAAACFTLMHCCGLRTGEVRQLSPDRVDLREGHLDVLWSKGNRSRRLPLSEDVVSVLRACEETSRKRFGTTRARFFVSDAGNQVTTATVGVIFNRVWDQAGLARPAGGQRPRPYDFRHHFAYANIERWMAEGTDVTAMLPYLSRYMGHATIESTYYYVHTSPDFMKAYAGLTDRTRSVLPEVGFE